MVISMTEEVTVTTETQPTAEVEVKTAAIETEPAEVDKKPAEQEGQQAKEAIDPKIPEKVQKRIDHLTWERHQVERTLKAEIEQLKQQVLTAPKQLLNEPQIENFDTEGEFLEAKAQYLVDQKLQEIQAKSKEEQAKKDWESKLEKVGSVWKQTEQRLAAEKPDFQERVMYADSFVNTLDKQSASLARDLFFDFADKAPEVLYNLFDSPQKIEHFQKMTSRDREKAFYYEMFKLEGAPKPTPKVLSEPLTPVSGGGKTGKTLDEMSGEELIKWLKK